MAIAHGGALDAAIARFGGVREDWLDLSTGINPVGYPVHDLDSSLWQRLPECGLEQRCEAAARAYYRVAEGAACAIAPGTQAVIQCLGDVLDAPVVDVVTPSYGEYLHVLGARGRACATLANVEQAVVIANPNNPDGRISTRADIEALVNRGVTVIIDEAFADVAPRHSLVDCATLPGVMVMKSVGKFFGLAGMRLGFAFGDPRLVEPIRTRLGPWAVSGPALEIATCAFADTDWIAATRARLADDRAALENLLIKHDFSPVGATDLFVTVSHPAAHPVADALGQAHILVRRFDQPADWLRFGLPADQRGLVRLSDALAGVMLP